MNAILNCALLHRLTLMISSAFDLYCMLVGSSHDHAEQKMIQNLALHGVIPEDLVPALMTTHTVANPEYDPAEAKRQQQEREEDAVAALSDDISEVTLVAEQPKTPNGEEGPSTPTTSAKATFQTTARVLDETTAAQIPALYVPRKDCGWVCGLGQIRS